MNGSSLFAPRMLVAWLTAAVLLFAAAVYFAGLGGGHAPGINAVGPSTFSRSALGYAGIADILRRLKIDVVKSRSESVGKLRQDGVLVIAEPNVGVSLQPQQLRSLLGANNVLLILPKRVGRRSQDQPAWIDKAELLPETAVAQLLQVAVAKAELVRAPETTTGWSRNDIGTAPKLTAPVQLIKPGALRPVVAARDGVLVGELRSGARRLWILADPDAMENHGIDEPGNAAFSLGLINGLRGRDGNVVFDETVHGYVDQPGTPWTLLFEFPYVLATLQGVVAVGLLLWATMGRFGAPLPSPSALQAGKHGLIHNTAKLFEFAGYQAVIVQRYVQAIVRDAARQLHAPPGLSDAATVAWLDRVGRAHEVGLTCGAVVQRATDLPRDRRRGGALAELARDIYRWKREIIDGGAGRSRHRAVDSRRGTQGGGRPG